MAEQRDTITIRFKPEGDKALINAIRTLDGATKKLVSTQVGLQNGFVTFNKTNSKTSKGLLDTNHNTRILGGAFATVRSKLLLLNFAMGLGVRQLVRFTEQSARVESMERAFTTLSGGVGNANIAMDKLEKATNNTMSEFDLFQQANNAMILGVSKNSDEMAEMFDIAQRLGRALGRDTASSVESLITGIGRQSRLMLDNIGIIVKADEAYESYAKKLGKTAKDLTDTEKKQAFLNATMESARAKVKSLGDETLTTQDSFDKFTASISNLASAIGDNLGIFAKLGEIFAEYANSVADSIKNLSEREKLERDLIFHRERLIDLHSLEFLKIKEKRDHDIQGVRNDITLTEQKIEAIQKLLDVFIKEDEQKAEAQEEEKERIEKLTEAEKKRAEALKELARGMKQAKEEETERDKQVNKTLEFANKLSSALAQATLNGQHMGEAVVNSIRAIAVEIASKAFIFTAFQALGIGGVGTAGKTLSQFLGFAHTGGLIKEDGNIQKFATGGMVQGQDNVPIMAQAGEFVIRKAVVEQVGVDNLARLNNGEGSVGSTVNVNINGNMIGNEEFVRDTLIPEINKTVRQGLA